MGTYTLIMLISCPLHLTFHEHVYAALMAALLLPNLLLSIVDSLQHETDMLRWQGRADEPQLN